ncbi:MAG: OsmC family protein [Bacteroidetes bacterium]|nr:MAG: OsmC family protein [Bacteroidota bacterium]
MKSYRLSFSNGRGDSLSAILDLPLGERPRAFAIFAHCFTCGKNLRAERHLSLALTQEGIALLRFDFTGLGESDGAFYDTNFSTNVADILAAADFLDSEYQAPRLLIGHSLGGAAVLMAARQLDTVQAVATIGAPAEPAHVKGLFVHMEDIIRARGEAEVRIAGRPFTIRRQFLDNIESTPLAAEVAALRKAVLILHSLQDTVVGVDNARKLYEAARHPKSFVTLDGADHLLTRKADALYTGRLIAAWGSRYLDLDVPKPLLTEQQAVVRLGARGFTTEVQVGHHHFLADEPTKVGGDDLGPAPYDLLLASLGTCTAMTVRMYADRKGWSLEEVRVHLSHRKDYPSDARQAGEHPAKLDHIDRILELEGPLDTEQRARLIEIANRCPVHRTLHSEIVVETRLREGTKP